MSEKGRKRGSMRGGGGKSDHEGQWSHLIIDKRLKDHTGPKKQGRKRGVGKVNERMGQETRGKKLPAEGEVTTVGLGVKGHSQKT